MQLAIRLDELPRAPAKVLRAPSGDSEIKARLGGGIAELRSGRANGHTVRPGGASKPELTTGAPLAAMHTELT